MRKISARFAPRPELRPRHLPGAVVYPAQPQAEGRVMLHCSNSLPGAAEPG
jgi:hypothetical protein